MVCGREDFTCDPLTEFPCVWFGTSEDSIVKTGFIDDDDFSSTTHRIRGLSFANFIFIQSCGHSVCFGIPQYLRDILCHEPRFPVFHWVSLRAPPMGYRWRHTIFFFRYSVIPLQHSKGFSLPFLQGFCGHSIYPVLLNNRWF